MKKVYRQGRETCAVGSLKSYSLSKGSSDFSVCGKGMIFFSVSASPKKTGVTHWQYPEVHQLASRRCRWSWAVQRLPFADLFLGAVWLQPGWASLLYTLENFSQLCSDWSKSRWLALVQKKVNYLRMVTCYINAAEFFHLIPTHS